MENIIKNAKKEADRNPYIAVALVTLAVAPLAYKGARALVKSNAFHDMKSWFAEKAEKVKEAFQEAPAEVTALRKKLREAEGKMVEATVKGIQEDIVNGKTKTEVVAS